MSFPARSFPKILFTAVHDFPLSAGGLFALAGGGFVLVRGLADRSPYELVLAVFALGLWLLLFLTGFFAARRLMRLSPGWCVPRPVTAVRGGGRAGGGLSGGGVFPGAEHTITGLDAGLPYFFRLHFTAAGDFIPGPGARFSAFFEAPADGGGTASLAMRFPLSGVFQGTGLCRLRDVFGLFSFPCGESIDRSFSIEPAPFERKSLLRIDPFSGAEDKKSSKQADEERYYMREYAPGDRFRDINWKTSARLASLITRISPHTEEKTHLVHIVFRNYGPSSGAGLFPVWLLDRAKARLMLFLRTLKEEHPNFIFHIASAGEKRLVESSEELELFFEDLACLSFVSSAGGGAASLASDAAALSRELYIFSTACDTGLAAFLASRAQFPSYVFMVMPARKKRGAGAAKAGGEAGAGAGAGGEAVSLLHHADIITDGFIRVSGFPAGGKVSFLETVPSPVKGRVEINYAEMRL
ncbi:MAG: DUF58 domain-containing protein [Spirochaetales bacterium]|jgi:hypothetical protein|nr:DUF58 domain-containing protein [Spirochaetales bacterium]